MKTLNEKIQKLLSLTNEKDSVYLNPHKINIGLDFGGKWDTELDVTDKEKLASCIDNKIIDIHFINATRTNPDGTQTTIGEERGFSETYLSCGKMDNDCFYDKFEDNFDIKNKGHACTGCKDYDSCIGKQYYDVLNKDSK
jgi:hypothetical protein